MALRMSFIGCVLLVADLPCVHALDPVGGAQKLVTAGLCILLLVGLVAFVWKYQRRVLMILTGDDRLHVDVNNCIWYFFCRCCGNCSGEWTTYCGQYFPCCCWKGNLVRKFGQFLGLVSKTVEIKSIVAGDLPYDKGRGDFYLSVECATNPPMVTSMAEDQKPKVVHWPETITLKLRDTPIEPPVRFVIRELEVFGSTDICELYISAKQILDWVDDVDTNDKDDKDPTVKRFQMIELNKGMTRATPAWICMNFCDPMREDKNTPADAFDRKLYELHSSHPKNTIRTINSTGKDASPSQKDWKLDQFKDTYQLIDSTGNPVDEPDEKDLSKINTLRAALYYFIKMFTGLVYMLIFTWGCFRFYVWSCYRQFRFLTMAALIKETPPVSYPMEEMPTFPISQAHLKHLRQWCADDVQGTGAKPGSTPCRPTDNRTMLTCTNASVTTFSQPRPRAFVAIVYDVFGVETKGLPCFNGICAVRGMVKTYDIPVAALLLSLFVVSWLFKQCGNWYIKKVKADMQKAKKAAKKDFYTKLKGGTGSTQGGTHAPAE